jgi:amidohydrolase
VNSELKNTIIESIDANRRLFTGLSLKIHDNPEIGFREEKASSWLTGFLEEYGFTVERGICGLPTAFRARYGKGKPAIGILAEYDALPVLGHACGHNIICACAVAAGIAVKTAVDLFGGTIFVIGTPAEETYGGKTIMAEKGAFTNLDAAMMIHPDVTNYAMTEALACQNLDTEFFGKAAHAAASPERGINALEAMLISFNAINSLRQHIRSSARIHGIITDGGQAPNIVPDHSSGSFLVRALENDYLDELKDKVINCFLAASTATGARLEYKWGARYDSLLNNVGMAQLFVNNMNSLGRETSLTHPGAAFGSTDMGNVSHLVPSIHGFVSIADPGTLVHSPEFALAAASEKGMQGMLDGAKALGMTAFDLISDSRTLAVVREEFNQAK